MMMIIFSGTLGGGEKKSGSYKMHLSTVRQVKDWVQGKRIGSRQSKWT